MIYFGIGTRSNNAFTPSSVLTTTSGGLITAIYNGTTLSRSYIDSGTNFLGFTDPAIPQCTGDIQGWYCPVSAMTLTPTLRGQNLVTATPSIVLNNAKTLWDSNQAVLPGLGADPFAFDGLTPYTNSFNFGLPFYFGRTLYTGIEGKAIGTYTGPLVAF